ncbi:formin BNR1 TDEL_0F05560 [Torulaspora delbrueckii]|uniref:FH2 domain-containing protein n=1 Tax=Torulaspora delbrueckii TaxID=4950 RepID=G8ZXM3_TORDE|nr:hypothetical protein TDEL_0F05560 [Torulaspora delbrueckii]CCE93367.1 hypothetical protein TDEL_0F05560 [Torulaspora delbrueckii]
MELVRSGYAGERWVDPHDYKRRSRSLEGDPAGLRTRKPSRRTGTLGTNEVVRRGLLLAGCALQNEGGVTIMKTKNFSTSEIDSQDGEHGVKFDHRSPPEDGSVEEQFNTLLSDGTYFWGEARKNLTNMSREKKWGLICALRSSKTARSSSESVNSTFTRQQLLEELDYLIKRKTTDHSKLLHQLEKYLRTVDFTEEFLERDNVKGLFQNSSLIGPDDFYVYLRCFKTLMNHKQGRLQILNKPPLLMFFCKLLNDDVTRLKCKVVSAEMLLMLTYVDEDYGYEKVLHHLSPCFQGWFNYMAKTLSRDPSEFRDASFLGGLKPEKCRADFMTTSLLVVNSILQALPTKDQKVSLMQTLKECGIHHCFHLIKQLQVDDTDKQIAIYLELETELIEATSAADQIDDSVYQPALHYLLSRTKGTLIEQDLAHLFESLNKILATRTTSESIKLFRSLGSILDYLIDNFCQAVSTEPASLVQESINKFLDNLESEEIGRRAMKEMTELENTIVVLRKELSELRDFKDISKEKLVTELKHAKMITKTKDEEITELSKKLEESKEMRRHEKKRFDHALSHQQVKGAKLINTSVFDNLKSTNDTHKAKPARAKSLLKSQKIHSLSSYIANAAEPVTIGPNWGVLGLNEEGNDADQSVAFTRDSSIATATNIAYRHESTSTLLCESSNPLSSGSIDGPSGVIRIEMEDSKIPPLPELPELPPISQALNKNKSEPPPSSSFSPLLPAAKESEQSTTLSPPPPPPPPPPPLPESLIVPGKESFNSEVPSGPPPPPPPLPASFQVEGSSILKPKEALKQIHWEKLNDIEETLWADQNQKDETMKELKRGGIFSQIEESFKVKERTIKQTKNKDKREKTPTKSFLPRDVAQQFGINLHMFSQYSPEQFVLKVLQCDNEIIQNSTALEFFTREDLVNVTQSLRRAFDPYSTDYLSEDGPSKDPAELDRPDRIFLELCYNLQYYWYERSFCLFTLTTYERDYYDFIYRLQKIDDVIQKLRHGTRFKSILYIIVEIGNYMNKRPAEGIKLSSLNKLAFVKSSVDKNTSFLHFLERIIRVKYPDLYGFTDDLSKVEDIGKISLDHLEQECNEFRSKIDEVVHTLKEGKLSDHSRLHPKDLIVEKITYKIRRAKVKSDLLQDQFKLINIDLKKLMSHFGEDFNDSEAKNSFFQHFIEFSVNFKKCAKENIEREDSQRVYEQRKNMLESRQRTASNHNSDLQGEDEDAVDVLLAKLRGTEEKPGLVRRRKITRYTADAAAQTRKHPKKRPIPAGSNGVLFERTQAMLKDTQNI